MNLDIFFRFSRLGDGLASLFRVLSNTGKCRGVSVYLLLSSYNDSMDFIQM